MQSFGKRICKSALARLVRRCGELKIKKRLSGAEIFSAPLFKLNVFVEAFAAGALFAAGAANVNFIQSAVTAVVVILAVGNVASNTEIDIFHKEYLRFYFVPHSANYTAAIDKRVVKMVKYSR